MKKPLSFFSEIKDRKIRKGLLNAVWDGGFWAVMYGLAEHYIIPFAVFFGANAFQVSLITGTSQLGIAAGQLSGAKFIQHYKKRKSLTMICVTIHALSWFGLFYGTWFTRGVITILLFFAVGFLAGNFSAPGWVSWMNDLVPPQLRGRYWGFRNRAIGFTQFAAISIGGILLYLSARGGWELYAFGILFTAAAVARLVCLRFLKKQYEPEMAVADRKNEFKFTVFLSKLRTTNFGRFGLFSFFMTFSVNLMGPLASVHLLKSLHFNYLQYMAVMMTSMVFSFVAMNYWGPLTDRYGNYRILTATAIAIPIIPIGWVFFKGVPMLTIIQVFTGFIWAGFNLSTANFIYDAVRKENISKIIAYFNTMNNIAAFSGALTGGALAHITERFVIRQFSEGNYELIFALSAFMRIIIIIIFIRGFKEVREVEKSPGLEHFYIYQPVTNIINRFASLSGRRRRDRED